MLGVFQGKRIPQMLSQRLMSHCLCSEVPGRWLLGSQVRQHVAQSKQALGPRKCPSPHCTVTSSLHPEPRQCGLPHPSLSLWVDASTPKSENREGETGSLRTPPTPPTPDTRFRDERTGYGQLLWDGCSWMRRDPSLSEDG